MKRVAVINIVGLTARFLGPHTPRLQALAASGTHGKTEPAFPAVTCSAQAAYLTGKKPEHHGIVGNGWYDRDLAEVHFWKQSNHLVTSPKVWELLRGRDSRLTCAKLFWWFNMYSSADVSITPRPMYPADGRKIFDIYTWPPAVRSDVKAELGEFPFATFWGPAAGRPTPQGAPDAASRWIADAAVWVERRYAPTLNLIYLPHLDYNLQRLGPGDPRIADDLRRIDGIAGALIDHLRDRQVRVLVISEYGVTPVGRVIHLNRLFRERGWLRVREELGRELLDAGASRVFAVADHQVAHVYVNEASLTSHVQDLIGQQEGVASVMDAGAQERVGLRHRRSGDLVAVAREDAWFSYYYWLDDLRAPDFARTVDIHRKPGYDPAELFLDPALPAVRLRILWRLLQKRLGLRMLMDVVPLDASLVRGSHGAKPSDPLDWPVAIADEPGWWEGSGMAATDVFHLIQRMVLEEGR